MKENIDEANAKKGIVDMLQQWNVLANNLDVLHREMGSKSGKDCEIKEELADTFIRLRKR
jgi:hypothetical protein